MGGKRRRDAGGRGLSRRGHGLMPRRLLPKLDGTSQVGASGQKSGAVAVSLGPALQRGRQAVLLTWGLPGHARGLSAFSGLERITQRGPCGERSKRGPDVNRALSCSDNIGLFSPGGRGAGSPLGDTRGRRVLPPWGSATVVVSGWCASDRSIHLLHLGLGLPQPVGGPPHGWGKD